MTKFVDVEAKTVLIQHRFRDNWFWVRYAINPYRGCQFSCNYCDAITGKYLVHADYHDFSGIIYVKKNAPHVLKREIEKFKPDVVGLSGVTDPYQPAEAKYELTRRLLQILADNRFPVHIGTKSDLVLRDLDLLEEIKEKTWCTVSLTIITFDRNLLPYLEPFAPSPERRLKVIKKLNKEGIQAGVNFIPIVPYLLDTPENMEKVIKRVSKHAKYVLIGSGMTLRDNQRIKFMELLNKSFPQLVDKYENMYGGMRTSPPRSYMLNLNKLAFELCRKYGIKNYIPPPTFERYTSQQKLIPMEEFERGNYDLASHLLLIAFFKEFKSGNIYSAWNYHKAAENIEDLNESIRDICHRGKLKENQELEKE